ncbi:MAG TPA: Hint domain-containing protein [Rhodobacteraceae bacterium]|nr:Hint domain-containing protein [Paracoccaceae bacterium]
MSSYEITFYSRDDITFGRDANGEFTVTVKEGASPETIKIVDNDKGEAGETFEGGTGRGENAHQHNQEAYGSSNGTSFDGDPIQPLVALPSHENPDDQIMAIGVGEPVHTVGYGFTYEPVPGETVSFNYKGYDDSPSYESDSLYVEGEGDASGSSSGSEEKSSEPSASSGSSSSSDTSESSSASNASGTSGSSGGSGTSGSSGGSGTSGSSGGSGTSGSSGGSGPSGGGSDPSAPCCFTRGTAIRTARGEVLVEDLIIGDAIWTEGHGVQPIRWICQREVRAEGSFAPIRIRAGTLGADRDILVSPAHRMLIQGPEIEVIFGMPKALVAAKDLVNDTTITRETTLETVEYFHILSDQHEVLQAHGTLSESFFPDAPSIGDIDSAQREELFALFPELETSTHGYSIAYPGLMPHEVALLR